MKIRIPEGNECNNFKSFIICPFYDGEYNVCNLFKKGLIDDEYKIPECLKEFGNGGEFELVRKKEEEI